MNDENLTSDINKAIEKDLGVKLPPPVQPPARAGNGQAIKTDATHRERIDTLIAEVQMTLRILEEAKKRL